MADGSKPVEENELMLELSIGGIFGEPNRKREVQAIRRRRKREQVVKKQKDDLLPVWKKERIGNVGSVLGDGEVVVMNVNKKNCVLLPVACRSFRAYNMNVKPDEWEAGVVATDDSRSNSSNSQLDQQLASADQPTGSSKQTSTQHKEALVLARMLCVSTTGNGPNGRTVSGFLYRYTKNGVSIVCACHGESFTPAGFVEHAGGVDIAHPLKHITIFPTAFAS